MLILLFSLVLGIILIFLAIIAEKNYMEILAIFALIFGIVLLFIFGEGAIHSFITNINKPAEIASLNEKYKSLTYQLNNIDTLYANSRANDRKELFNQIEKWNSSIAANQLRHESLWTNWFYPVDYSQFELIELS